MPQCRKSKPTASWDLEKALNDSIRDGDMYFDRKNFPKSAECYERAVREWNLPLASIRELDLGLLERRIPRKDYSTAGKVLGRLGVRYQNMSENQGLGDSERIRLHNDAVAFLMCAIHLHPENNWNLIYLGTACTPKKDSPLSKKQMMEEAELAGECFETVLEDCGITPDHLSGAIPLGGFGGLMAAQYVPWALNGMGRLRLRQGLDASEGARREFYSQALDCFRTVLGCYDLPRDVFQVREMDKNALRRLGERRRDSIKMALMRMGEAFFHSGDRTEAYHALSLCLKLDPQNHISTNLCRRIRDEDPKIKARVKERVTGGTVKPAEILGRPRSIPAPELPDVKLVQWGKPLQEPPKPPEKPKSWSEMSRVASTTSPPEILKKFGLGQAFMMQEWRSVKLPVELEGKYRDESKILLREVHALAEGGPSVAGGFLTEYKARARRWHDTVITPKTLCQFLCEKTLLEAVANNEYNMSGRKEEAIGVALSYVGKAEQIPPELKPHQEVVEASYNRILEKMVKPKT